MQHLDDCAAAFVNVGSAIQSDDHDDRLCSRPGMQRVLPTHTSRDHRMGGIPTRLHLASASLHVASSREIIRYNGAGIPCPARLAAMR
jgi:hypothetical protein